MSTFLVIIAFGWLFWNLAFREWYIYYKYKKAKPINIPVDSNKQSVFSILKNSLSYPDLKSIHWDTNGDIMIVGKYGKHKITIENNSLYVGRDHSKHSKNIEEAEIIDVYIRKIFDTTYPDDPYDKYKKMKKHKKNWVLIQLGIIIAAVIAFSVGMPDSDLYESQTSNNISNSYLNSYSETITIGKAFDAFFSDGKWSSYSEGAINYIDYTGTCMYGDEQAEMIIRFWHSDIEFRVEEIYINGEKMPDISHVGFLQTIFDSYESSTTIPLN